MKEHEHKFIKAEVTEVLNQYMAPQKNIITHYLYCEKCGEVKVIKLEE